MAGAETKRRPKRPPRGVLIRRWLVVAVIFVVGVSYYTPLMNYFHARSSLAARRAEVRALQRQKSSLERQVAASTSLDELAREARSLGYVRPGEHLYIVKGIETWLRTHAGSLGRGG